MALFPHTLANLLDGRHRVIYAPISVAVPDDISDIIDVVTPYAPKTGWIDLGGTAAPATAGRNITKTDWNLQQTNAVVNREVSQVEHAVTVTGAEYTPELMAIFYESTGVDTIAGGANKGAQKRVPFGSITALTPVRVAILALRPKKYGAVTEPGGGTRGPWVGKVWYRMELSADNAQESFAENEMVTFPLSLEALPEPTITADGEEHGFYIEEDAPQTIAAT